MAIKEKKVIKTYSLTEMKDTFLGTVGTPFRDEYEYALSMELMGETIKKIRQEQALTQEELGAMIGVQKAQISKLEKGTNSATIATILKVFKALKAEVHFSIKTNNQVLELV